MRDETKKELTLRRHNHNIMTIVRTTGRLKEEAVSLQVIYFNLIDLENWVIFQ